MAVGVATTIAPPPASSAAPEADERTLFLAGLAERGSTTEPMLIRSASEARVLLGERTGYSTLHDAIDSFFAEAAPADVQVYAVRDVGPAATIGTATLSDRAGSPVATLRLDAASKGPWSSQLTYTVEDGLVASTFTLKLFLNGDLVETHANLATPAAAVSALATSTYARAVDLGSATAAPGNRPAVVATPTALSAGTDDRASVTATTLLAALERMGPDLGPGIVAIPGQPHSTVAAGLASYAARTRRIAATAPAAGTSVTSAAAAARALRSTSGAAGLGFFYPHVLIPDGAGGSRTVSPEGAIAGLRARLGKTWAAPAGNRGLFQFVTGAEKKLTSAEINTLDADAVSTIRQNQAGTRLYGWRSLSSDELNYRMLATTDLINQLAFRGTELLEAQFPFSNVDGKGHLFVRVINELEALVAPMAADDPPAFYATDGSPGYLIDTSMNTPQTMQAGQILVEMGVRPTPIAQLIRFTLRAVPLTGTL